MNDSVTANTFRMLFLFAGLLNGFAFVGVLLAAGMKSGAWRKRPRYAIIGGIFVFLSCISASAFMLMDAPDVRALPILFLLSVVCSLGGTFTIFYSIWSTRWASKWLERHKNHLAEHEMEKDK